MAQNTKNGKTVTADDGKYSEYQPGKSWDTDEFVASNSPITVPYKYAGLFLTYTMLVGFGLSIMLAIIFRFEETTYTHCRVANYFPSTSAAIATTPSAYVWRLVICLCSLPRLLFVLYCYHFYINVSCQLRYYRGLCHLCFIAEMLENLSLIGLSCISSDDNYDIHEILFISFQVGAMLHMILMCIVFKMATTRYDDVRSDTGIFKRKGALQRKMFFCVMNILAFLISIYFFFRHQNRCEPGVYSLFAIFEYLVVLTNVLFHEDTWKDFSNRCIIYGGRTHNKLMTE
ncbi:post-GPI attachment to proteins factor 2-like [Amphiura filiformis]|uniref:post-GPI attachment to proteins factor 2-like n=1 Tax=Amphiura filiformis TaxID=82378 RepID=UPI003B21FF97